LRYLPVAKEPAVFAGARGPDDVQPASAATTLVLNIHAVRRLIIAAKQPRLFCKCILEKRLFERTLAFAALAF